jgi:putative SOS response-associated peptidase YedK
MPAILPPEAWSLWLGEHTAAPEHLKALLTPYPAEDMRMWPVSTRVGIGQSAQFGEWAALTLGSAARRRSAPVRTS